MIVFPFSLVFRNFRLKLVIIYLYVGTLRLETLLIKSTLKKLFTYILLYYLSANAQCENRKYHVNVDISTPT